MASLALYVKGRKRGEKAFKFIAGGEGMTHLRKQARRHYGDRIRTLSEYRTQFTSFEFKTVDAD